MYASARMCLSVKLESGVGLFPTSVWVGIQASEQRSTLLQETLTQGVADDVSAASEFELFH